VNQNQVLPHRGQFVFALCVYSALAVYGSLVPLTYQQVSWSEAIRRFAAIEYLRLGIESRADWVANILLFVPIGFLALGALLLDRSGKLRAVLCAVAVLLACVLASAAIEFTQIWFPPRTVSQNDIVAETLGGALGIGVWLAVGPRLVAWLRDCLARSQPGDRLDRLLQVYFVGLVIYSLLPLDLTISPAELWHKYREGKVQLVPPITGWGSLERWYDIVVDIIVLIPVGMLTATALMPRGTRVRPFGRSVLGGLLIVCGLEFGQLFVYSRFSSTLDLLTGTAGVAGGAWLMGRLRGAATVNSTVTAPRWTTAAPLLLMTVAYSGLLLAIFWAPFDFTTDADLVRRRVQGFFRVPFSALYWGSEFHAVTQVLRKLLLFAPLGALGYRATQDLASRGMQRTMGWFLLFCVAFLPGLAIEIGQLFLPEHVPDLTDVLLYVCGALAGIFACRWVAG
jgi:glycopeptide antibiotics resistance protein